MRSEATKRVRSRVTEIMRGKEGVRSTTDDVKTNEESEANGMRRVVAKSLCTLILNNKIIISNK